MTSYQGKAVPGRPLLTFYRYARPYAREFTLGALFAIVFLGLSLVMPWLIGKVVGLFHDNQMTPRILTWMLVALIVLAVISALTRYWQRTLMIRASRKAEYDLRNDFFRHVQSLSRDFFNSTKTGDLMTRSTSDLDHVRSFIGPGIMGSIDMLRIPFTLAYMFYLSTPLTLMALVPLPFVSIAVYLFLLYINSQSRRVQERFSQVTSRAQENLAGARVVQAYAASDREIEAFSAASRAYMWESMKLSIVSTIGWVVIPMMVAVALLIIVGRGGIMVINGTLGIDHLTTFLICMINLAWPIAQFGWILSLYQRGAVSMRRILDIMKAVPTVRDTSVNTEYPTQLQGHIEFENVSFAFNNVPVLHDISFVVEPGQTVAIVGPTGAGKSTIVSLLTREYDPTSGRVLLDGLDARTIPLRVLRHAIGYVPQDTFLFSDSIRTNLTFGNLAATEQDIIEASDTAQFTETMAEMPAGLETLLGERGVNLSGGQKQRLAIARAVIRNPTILVMDDALSSVDTHTEAAILQRLKPFAEQRSTILISHRLSSIQHADLILFIDDGRIVERGTHASLLQEEGHYAELYRRQLLEEELEYQQ